MVRGFGVLLVIGIALAFGCALTAGFAAMVLGEQGAGRPPPAPLRAVGGALASAGHGARDLVVDAWLLAVGDPAGPAPETAVLRRRSVAWAIDVAVIAGAVWLLSGRGLSFVEVVVGGALAALAYLVVLQGLSGGTLGRLVNDPSLYHDAKALVGGARKSWMLRFFGGGGSAAPETPPPTDAPAGARGQP